MLDAGLVDEVIADQDIIRQPGIKQSLRVDDRFAILLRDAAGQFPALAIEDAADRAVTSRRPGSARCR